MKKEDRVDLRTTHLTHGGSYGSCLLVGWAGLHSGVDVDIQDINNFRI